MRRVRLEHLTAVLEAIAKTANLCAIGICAMRRPACDTVGATHAAPNTAACRSATAARPACLHRTFVADNPNSPVPIFCVNKLTNQVRELKQRRMTSVLCVMKNPAALAAQTP